MSVSEGCTSLSRVKNDVHMNQKRREEILSWPRMFPVTVKNQLKFESPEKLKTTFWKGGTSFCRFRMSLTWKKKKKKNRTEEFPSWPRMIPVTVKNELKFGSPQKNEKQHFEREARPFVGSEWRSHEKKWKKKHTEEFLSWPRMFPVTVKKRS